MRLLQYEFSQVVALEEAMAGEKIAPSRSPRLVVLPNYLSGLLVIGGGAFTFGGFVFVNEKLAKAGPEIRRFVMAHEAAHNIFGHCHKMLAYWMIVFVAAILIPGHLQPEAGRLAQSILLGLAIAVSELAKPNRWELEADKMAAQVVGVEIGRQTLDGVFSWYGVRRGKFERKRLDALVDPSVH